MPAPVAQLEDVSRIFGRFAALRHVSAEFVSGRCYVLLGENGAGKSTLLRVLAGLLPPTAGRVRLFSEDPNIRRPAMRAKVGFMGHAAMLYEELSAVENLRYFASLYRSCACLEPEEALRSVELDPTLRRPVGQYSQGMRQRLSLARVLIAQPDLILLDEPFSNMDAASAGKMIGLLVALRAAGRCILLTTHQRDLAAPLADYFVTMDAGRLVSVLSGPALADPTKAAPESPSEER